jgi:hypothetical protein
MSSVLACNPFKSSAMREYRKSPFSETDVNVRHSLLQPWPFRWIVTTKANKLSFGCLFFLGSDIEHVLDN